jgi:hypothetical protein
VRPDAEWLDHTGAESLEEDVRPRGEREHHLDAFDGLEVDLDWWRFQLSRS